MDKHDKNEANRLIGEASSALWKLREIFLSGSNSTVHSFASDVEITLDELEELKGSVDHILNSRRVR